MKFFLFLIEIICCDPSSERLIETVQMKVATYIFMQNSQKISLSITKYCLLSRALKIHFI